MLILLPVFLNTKKKKKEIIVKYCAFTVEMVIYLGVQQCPTFLSSHYPFLFWK